MAEDQPTNEPDVTKAWHASQDQKSKAKKLRIFAAISWIIAIGAEIVGVYLLIKDKFNEGNLALLIGILVVIAIFAIAGSFLWKAANKHDPAKKSEPFRFFVQNQLGVIITVIAFLPLLALIFLDKDMDPKNKKIAGGVGVALVLLASVLGIDFNPASVEQYSEDMNKCAAQIKANEPTTACSPAVAEQAKDIVRDSEAVAEATRSTANPDGLDVVYWITPPEGEKEHDSPRVFHLCPEVSTLKDKPVSSGSVTEAYSQNAIRITKQIEMEQRQCGFAPAE